MGALWKLVDGDRQQNWNYIGRYCAHSRPITGIAFGRGDSGNLQLISVAEDRMLVEYDLAASTAGSGVAIVGAYCIEEVATPMACVWHPQIEDDYEQRIITTNSDMKLRQWNAENK